MQLLLLEGEINSRKEGLTMRRFILLITLTLSVTISTVSQVGQKMMTMKVNGNSYPMYDLFADSLMNLFRASAELIKSQLYEKIDEECIAQTGYGVLNFRYQVPFPKELKSLAYSEAGDGIFKKKNLSEDSWKSVLPYIFTAVRGNSVNDIFAVGIGGRIMHYNGITWVNYQGQTGLPSCIYGNLDMKGNLVVAVGEDNQRGVVLIGKRY
jgi:hypothetical protein